MRIFYIKHEDLNDFLGTEKLFASITIESADPIIEDDGTIKQNENDQVTKFKNKLFDNNGRKVLSEFRVNDVIIPIKIP